ncbi:MAG: hypothetical protein IJW63_04380 [Lachnospiraceae bacterium]|nr:hypothetical protein [Lachnospiraceae bacterium]
MKQRRGEMFMACDRGIFRKSRKECLEEIGLEVFDFNKEYELLKYKYLSFEKLSRKEWKQCQRCIKCKGMPNKYCIWREEIREKYSNYNITELLDFKRYLELCAEKRKGIIWARKRVIERGLYTAYQKVIEEIIEFKKG